MINNSNDLIWIEVLKTNLIHNLKTFQKLVGNSTILAPCIKGNAYGHGLLPIAHLFIRHGATILCINSIEEAIRLRNSGIKASLLLLGYTQESNLREILKYRIIPLIYDVGTAISLSQISKKTKELVKVHIMIDTGMSREGILPKNILKSLALISSLPGIKIEGIATHFATAVNGPNDRYFKMQFDIFQKLKQKIKINPQNNFMFHANNSAAIITNPKSNYDLVRPGISLFGYYSNEIVEKECMRKKIFLKPALMLKTKIAQIKTIPKGSCVNYGCAYITPKITNIAIIPIGYADGLDKRLSNIGKVIINGQIATIRGKICMGMIVADITDIPNAKVEDEVVIVGQQGKAEITLSDIVDNIDSSKGEFLTNLRESIKRYYI